MSAGWVPPCNSPHLGPYTQTWLSLSTTTCENWAPVSRELTFKGPAIQWQKLVFLWLKSWLIWPGTAWAVRVDCWGNFWEALALRSLGSLLRVLGLMLLLEGIRAWCLFLSITLLPERPLKHCDKGLQPCFVQNPGFCSCFRQGLYGLQHIGLKNKIVKKNLGQL